VDHVPNIKVPGYPDDQLSSFDAMPAIASGALWLTVRPSPISKCAMLAASWPTRVCGPPTLYIPLPTAMRGSPGISARAWRIWPPRGDCCWVRRMVQKTTSRSLGRRGPRRRRTRRPCLHQDSDQPRLQTLGTSSAPR
jgi:hypothetical protein